MGKWNLKYFQTTMADQGFAPGDSLQCAWTYFPNRNDIKTAVDSFPTKSWATIGAQALHAGQQMWTCAVATVQSFQGVIPLRHKAKQRFKTQGTSQDPVQRTTCTTQSKQKSKHKLFGFQDRIVVDRWVAVSGKATRILVPLPFTSQGGQSQVKVDAQGLSVNESHPAFTNEGTLSAVIMTWQSAGTTSSFSSPGKPEYENDVTKRWSKTQIGRLCDTEQHLDASSTIAGFWAAKASSQINTTSPFMSIGADVITGIKSNFHAGEAASVICVVLFSSASGNQIRSQNKTFWSFSAQLVFRTRDLLSQSQPFKPLSNLPGDSVELAASTWHLGALPSTHNNGLGVTESVIVLHEPPFTPSFSLIQAFTPFIDDGMTATTVTTFRRPMFHLPNCKLNKAASSRTGSGAFAPVNHIVPLFTCFLRVGLALALVAFGCATLGGVACLLLQLECTFVASMIAIAMVHHTILARQLGVDLRYSAAFMHDAVLSVIAMADVISATEAESTHISCSGATCIPHSKPFLPVPGLQPPRLSTVPAAPVLTTASADHERSAYEVSISSGDSRASSSSIAADTPSVKNSADLKNKHKHLDYYKAAAKNPVRAKGAVFVPSTSRRTRAIRPLRQREITLHIAQDIHSAVLDDVVNYYPDTDNPLWTRLAPDERSPRSSREDLLLHATRAGPGVNTGTSPNENMNPIRDGTTGGTKVCLGSARPHRLVQSRNARLDLGKSALQVVSYAKKPISDLPTNHFNLQPANQSVQLPGSLSPKPSSTVSGICDVAETQLKSAGAVQKQCASPAKSAPTLESKNSLETCPKLESDAFVDFKKALSIGAPVPAVAAKASARLGIAFDSSVKLLGLLGCSDGKRQDVWNSFSPVLQSEIRALDSTESKHKKGTAGSKLSLVAEAQSTGLAAALTQMKSAALTDKVGKAAGFKRKKTVKLPQKPKIKRFAWAVIREVPPNSVWHELATQAQLSEDRLQALLSQASIALSGFSLVRGIPGSSPPAAAAVSGAAATPGQVSSKQQQVAKAASSPEGPGKKLSLVQAAAASGQVECLRKHVSQHKVATSKDLLLSEFRDLFSQNARGHGKGQHIQTRAPKKGGGKAVVPPTVLGPKRVMNLNITWRRLGVSAIQLQSVVQTLDNSMLSVKGHAGAGEVAYLGGEPHVALLDDSQLALLPNLVLSRDEVQNLQGARSNGCKLSGLENMLLDLNMLPGCQERLHALSVSASWHTRAAELQSTLDAIEECMQQVRSCQGLRAVLTAALALARTASLSEETTARSGSCDFVSVQGVKLSTLAALDRTKASDGRSTVLHYLECMASCLQSDAVQQVAALSSCRSTAVAARIPFTSISSDAAALNKDAAVIDRVIQSTGSSAGASMTSFCDAAKLSLADLERHLLQQKLAFIQLLEFFGEAPVSVQELDEEAARERICSTSHAWLKALVDLAAKLQRVHTDRLRWARTREAAAKRQERQQQGGERPSK